MSRGERGPVPAEKPPFCTFALPRAVVLTAVAMVRHRREVWSWVRPSGSLFSAPLSRGGVVRRTAAAGGLGDVPAAATFGLAAVAGTAPPGPRGRHRRLPNLGVPPVSVGALGVLAMTRAGGAPRPGGAR